MDGQASSQRVKRTQRDYSLVFKLQVVYEVEKGELSWKQAQSKYGIQGRSTVLAWLRKHGSLNWQTDHPMKGKLTPQTTIRELQKKLKRLEMKNEILERTIEIADEKLGTDIRKKYLELLLKASEQQPDEASPSA